jgi:hypothetical protein
VSLKVLSVLMRGWDFMIEGDGGEGLYICVETGE